jgi:Tol biopolymer transport system component
VRSSSRILAVTALAILALAILAATAAAAPKEIAYVCKGEDICLLDPDNPGNVTNLTDDGATSFDEDPAWSPDGNRLAFVARYTGKSEENIFTMEPAATGNQANVAVQVTHFTNGLVPTGEIAWSPDGSKIAFVRGAVSAGNNPLYVANSDGSSAIATKITEAGQHPTWSRDSAKIAFSHNNQVFLVNPDNSSPAAPLPGAAGEEPAWSPDGSRIAYGREFHSIEIIGSGGGTPLAIPNNSQFAFASWSPSGAQLAYHEQEGESSYFQIVNADGSGKHHLPIVQSLNANGPAPSWSPDGLRLVFQGFFFGGGADTNEVYIANSDGSGSVTPLTPDQGFSTEPAWRPNLVTRPQVFTPSQGGSTGPLPGPTIKPKTVWFTNRIPWTPGPPYVPMMSVGCDAAACNVGAKGTASGARAAGILIAPEPAATVSAKPKKSKKPKPVVVASGKVHVPANQKRTLKLKLTKAAIAAIEKVGKLKMTVTVTIAIAGQKPTTESRKVEVFLKPAKGGHHKR